MKSSTQSQPEAAQSKPEAAQSQPASKYTLLGTSLNRPFKQKKNTVVPSTPSELLPPVSQKPGGQSLMGKSNPIHNQRPPTSGDQLLDDLRRRNRDIFDPLAEAGISPVSAAKADRKYEKRNSSIQPPNAGNTIRRARPAPQSGSPDPSYKILNDASSSPLPFIRTKRAQQPDKPKGGSHTRKKPRMKSKIKNTRRRITKEKLRKTIKRTRGSSKRNKTEIKKARPASAPASVGSKSSNDNTLQ
jgi:hypothetical protein